ncbi:hypothetical protein GQ53DRAFT_99991 [Thozetella sp. PMI_491]|nr:hypothetical protein GQ53DRAFT_99991 [Thozetella sp. PMI_491]
MTCWDGDVRHQQVFPSWERGGTWKGGLGKHVGSLSGLLRPLPALLRLGSHPASFRIETSTPSHPTPLTGPAPPDRQVSWQPVPSPREPLSAPILRQRGRRRVSAVASSLQPDPIQSCPVLSSPKRLASALPKDRRGEVAGGGGIPAVKKYAAEPHAVAALRTKESQPESP